jgi:hypothetical protein
MGFSVLVEMLNLRLRKVTATPVNLHDQYTVAAATGGASSVTNVSQKNIGKKKNSKKRK